MIQTSFADAENQRKGKKTRREAFLEEMEKVVPWEELLTLIEPHYPLRGNGRPPYPLATMLRIHFLQQWFGYSDLAMEEALYEVVALRRFAQLSLSGALPDETTILNFRRRLETHALAEQLFAQVNKHLESKGLLLRKGTIVDATIINAPTSIKNSSGKRDPEMHQTKKGNQWYHGMKAHIGVDTHGGLVHTLTTTAANVADVTQTAQLLHGQEKAAYADAGYTGAEKRPECEDKDIDWRIAAKRSKISKLVDSPLKEALQDLETLFARVRARVEHPFRVIKRQFGFQKVRYRGLAKNTAQLYTLFSLSNLWMVRKKLLAMG